MRLTIESKTTERGLYLSATYKGVKYGQAYTEGQTLQQAQTHFQRIVRLMAQGETRRVMAGVN